MPRPLVAIVGRPNVGKSMLFNKLTGQRAAIVEDTPGVTRDRIYGTCEWRGRTFDLMDTGGIEPGTDSEILQFMRRQAEIAIETADVIIMGDEPSKIPAGIRIARRTRRIATENIVFSICFKAAVMLLSVLGMVELWAAVFADVGVCMICVLNTLRVNMK